MLTPVSTSSHASTGALPPARDIILTTHFHPHRTGPSAPDTSTSPHTSTVTANVHPLRTLRPHGKTSLTAHVHPLQTLRRHRTLPPSPHTSIRSGHSRADLLVGLIKSGRGDQEVTPRTGRSALRGWSGRVPRDGRVRV